MVIELISALHKKKDVEAFYAFQHPSQKVLQVAMNVLTKYEKKLADEIMSANIDTITFGTKKLRRFKNWIFVTNGTGFMGDIFTFNKSQFTFSQNEKLVLAHFTFAHDILEGRDLKVDVRTSDHWVEKPIEKNGRNTFHLECIENEVFIDQEVKIIMLQWKVV